MLAKIRDGGVWVDAQPRIRSGVWMPATANWAKGPPPTKTLSFFPLGVATDSSGNIYVADYSGRRIVVIPA